MAASWHAWSPRLAPKEGRKPRIHGVAVRRYERSISSSTGMIARLQRQHFTSPSPGRRVAIVRSRRGARKTATLGTTSLISVRTDGWDKRTAANHWAINVAAVLRGSIRTRWASMVSARYEIILIMSTREGGGRTARPTRQRAVAPVKLPIAACRAWAAEAAWRTVVALGPRDQGGCG
jgi:hypothetical protein